MEKISQLIHTLSQRAEKGIAWLVDPAKDFFPGQFSWIKDSGLDLILVGGSTVSAGQFEEKLLQIKEIAGSIPVCIFPGSHAQLSDLADGILFLTLLSGRNPEYLISQQVKAAPKVKKMGLETLPTAYILVNEGEILSVHRASQTLPLSNHDLESLTATALAGQMMGMRICFLDAGSGASFPVSPQAVAAVKSTLHIPLLVGGGLDTIEKIRKTFAAGADMVVVGNSVEKDPGFLAEVLKHKLWLSSPLNVN